MLDAQRVREERCRKHTRAGAEKPRAEKKKLVVVEQANRLLEVGSLDYLRRMTRGSGAYSSPLLSSPCSIPPASRPPFRVPPDVFGAWIRVRTCQSSYPRSLPPPGGALCPPARAGLRSLSGVVAPRASRRGGDGWDVPRRSGEGGIPRSPLRLWAFARGYAGTPLSGARFVSGAGAARLKHPMAEAQRGKGKRRRKHTCAGGDGGAEEGGRCGAVGVGCGITLGGEEGRGVHACVRVQSPLFQNRH
ncbi:hypothetical protein C8J57DRAFT_1581046 [Mycena rebaudengoi]|nr:hypothetical protein C8J57DRAFT_1581046 [Mycena rebaudengoi]